MSRRAIAPVSSTTKTVNNLGYRPSAHCAIGAELDELSGEIMQMPQELHSLMIQNPLSRRAIAPVSSALPTIRGLAESLQVFH